MTLLRADARSLPLADASVDLIVTSPPYFALRSYTDGGEHYAGQIGSEATPAEFIAALTACTREWMRVLKPSGSIFVNLGDKYSGSSGGGAPSRSSTLAGNGHVGGGPKLSALVPAGHVKRSSTPAKSLMLLPERYRIACVDELGLIARAVVIWSKPNGLPEPVTDRVRRSHEDWVHLTKAPRYFAAVDEIREQYSERVRERQHYAGRDIPARSWSGDAGRNDGGGERGILGFGHNGINALGKLPGSVWEIASQPLTVPKELGINHFAAFPMEWPRRIILGWSPSGICVECREGRRPVVEKPGLLGGDNNPESRSGERRFSTLDGGQAVWERRMANPDRIVGYSCACSEPTAPTRPAVVLDPFGGTGTTALVAEALGRKGISVDMSADYCRLAQWRTTDPKQIERASRPAKSRKPAAPPEPVEDRSTWTQEQWIAHFAAATAS